MMDFLLKWLGERIVRLLLLYWIIVASIATTLVIAKAIVVL